MMVTIGRCGDVFERPPSSNSPPGAAAGRPNTGNTGNVISPVQSTYSPEPLKSQCYQNHSLSMLLLTTLSRAPPMPTQATSCSRPASTKKQLRPTPLPWRLAQRMQRYPATVPLRASSWGNRRQH